MNFNYVVLLLLTTMNAQALAGLKILNRAPSAIATSQMLNVSAEPQPCLNNCCITKFDLEKDTQQFVKLFADNETWFGNFILEYHGLLGRGLGNVKVLKNGNQLAGFILIALMNDSTNNELIALVCYLAIDPKFQRQGLAQFLLQHEIKLLKERGIKKIKLGVDPRNTNAQKLYEKMGFAKEQTASTEWLSYSLDLTK